jgi:hypothetical protein
MTCSNCVNVKSCSCVNHPLLAESIISCLTSRRCIFDSLILETMAHITILRRVVSKLKNVYIRGHKTWYPDAKWMDQFQGVVMYPDNFTSKLKRRPYNAKELPPEERKITNMVINFGPCHPAAHGCLRMITELDGEVSRYQT